MELSLRPCDFEDLELLRELLISFGKESNDCEAIYGGLAGILLRNVAKLELDEDQYNLTRFAVGLTSEVSPLLLSKESLGTNHWAWRPLFTKVGGINSKGSDIRTQAMQVAAMLRAFAVQLPRDPLYADGAEALERYLTSHQLWTALDDNIEY